MRSTLTFLHGFMGHPSDWDRVRAALGEHDASAPAISKATDWQSSVNQLAQAIPNRSIIVGYSMGARLALGIAVEHPEKCEALVFVSGNPGLESDDAREQRWSADQALADRLESEPLEQFLNWWYQQSVFTSLPENVRREETERKLARPSNQWPAILRTNSISKQPNYWPRLAELSMPILVVAGEDDEKYREIAVCIQEEIGEGKVTTHIVPGCGHMVHREQPETLAKLVSEFVQSVNPASPDC